MSIRGMLLQLVVLAALVGGGFTALSAVEDREAEACGPAGPFDFDTYEPENYRLRYNQAIELATAGKAITFDYSLSSGDYINVLYQGLQHGPRGARSGLDKSAAIPPSVYKSIAWIEANWANADYSVPYGGVGPVLRSFDCGYGIGQITSGMGNTTGNASGRQAVIGTHYLFNIAEGIRILADKWNTAPQFRPVAGKGDPAMLEDWYYAIWSYNGFAFSNHPLNPTRDPLRSGGTGISPIYHCFNPSAPSYQTNAGGVIYGYGSYTYPERVYGCMRYPPSKGDARLWDPQVFNMPDFSLEEIARAFDPEHYLACEEGGFSGGCANMDYPTTIEREGVAVNPHPDTTPPIDPSVAGQLLGAPTLAYFGPNAVEFIARPGGAVTSASASMANIGTGVGPFRIRTSAPWIVVRHPNESRRLDASVAVGSDIEVVKTATPRVAQSGYASQLLYTVDPALLPGGTSHGTIWLDPLFGGGGVVEIAVTAVNLNAGLDTRARAPSLAADD